MRVQTAFLLLLGLSLANRSIGSDIFIEKSQREYNAAKHIVIARETLTFKNKGSKAVNQLVLCQPADLVPNRAFYEVVQGTTEDAPDLTEMEPYGGRDVPANVSCEAVTLETALAPGKGTTLEAYSALIHQLVPRPREILQSENQRVLLTAPQHTLSPYPIASETTELKLLSRAVESYHGTPPASKSGTSIKYGPYSDVVPFSGGTLSAHFENNSPFLDALELTREIEVSHWGNVYVEEWYTVKHMGAQHKGEWSRLRYQQNPMRSGAATVKELTAVLPRDAEQLYFRDEIGNVSTSIVRRLRDKTEVRLQPRFPLLGGWQIKFIFGYSVKLQSVVKRKGGVRTLTLPFSTPIQNILVHDLTVKVVLPEGCTDIQTKLPFPVEQSFEKKYSYLDTLGRPVLVLRAKNMSPDHNVPLAVSYRFSSLYQLQEPLLLILAFFAFFCMVLVYTRCEFDLSPKKVL